MGIFRPLLRKTSVLEHPLHDANTFLPIENILFAEKRIIFREEDFGT